MNPACCSIYILMAHGRLKKCVISLEKKKRTHKVFCYAILGYLIFNYSFINMTQSLIKMNRTLEISYERIIKLTIYLGNVKVQ